MIRLRSVSVAVLSLLIYFSLQNQSVAWDARGLDLGTLGEDLLSEKHELKGRWADQKYWKGGWFCDGSWEYTANVTSFLDAVAFELLEDGGLDVKATLTKGYGRVGGTYVSEYSLCVPLSGWLGMSSDRVSARAHVDFIEHADGSTTLKVKVYETKFGRIHVGQYVPQWFEDVLTDAFNSALTHVWESSLGDWLSEKLSDIINKRLRK